MLFVTIVVLDIAVVFIFLVMTITKWSWHTLIILALLEMSANTIVHKTTTTPAIVGPRGNFSTLSKGEINEAYIKK